MTPYHFPFSVLHSTLQCQRTAAEQKALLPHFVFGPAPSRLQRNYFRYRCGQRLSVMWRDTWLKCNLGDAIDVLTQAKAARLLLVNRDTCSERHISLCDISIFFSNGFLESANHCIIFSQWTETLAEIRTKSKEIEVKPKYFLINIWFTPFWCKRANACLGGCFYEFQNEGKHKESESFWKNVIVWRQLRVTG